MRTVNCELRTANCELGGEGASLNKIGMSATIFPVQALNNRVQ